MGYNYYMSLFFFVFTVFVFVMLLVRFHENEKRPRLKCLKLYGMLHTHKMYDGVRLSIFSSLLSFFLLFVHILFFCCLGLRLNRFGTTKRFHSNIIRFICRWDTKKERDTEKKRWSMRKGETIKNVNGKGTKNVSCWLRHR